MRKGRRGALRAEAQTAEAVLELARRVNTVASGIIVLETILEEHGLMKPEYMESIRPKIQAKFDAMKAKADAPDPADATSCCEHDNNEAPK